MPKQRRRPRATLYSPPPSQARNSRVVETRESPGSRRNITSPRLTRSHRQLSFGLIFIAVMPFFRDADKVTSVVRAHSPCRLFEILESIYIMTIGVRNEESILGLDALLCLPWFFAVPPRQSAPGSVSQRFSDTPTNYGIAL